MRLTAKGARSARRAYVRPLRIFVRTRRARGGARPSGAAGEREKRATDGSPAKPRFCRLVRHHRPHCDHDAAPRRHPRRGRRASEARPRGRRAKRDGRGARRALTSAHHHHAGPRGGTARHLSSDSGSSHARHASRCSWTREARPRGAARRPRRTAGFDQRTPSPRSPAGRYRAASQAVSVAAATPATRRAACGRAKLAPEAVERSETAEAHGGL